MKWKCPICHSSAYKRYGGKNELAVIINDGDKDEPHRKNTQVKLGYTFECKGCSIFFNNPNKFNKENVDGHKQKKPS